MTAPRLKVLAAMSGGVDSAVAAARAVDAGHDVTGVHLALSAAPATLRHGARGCCTRRGRARCPPRCRRARHPVLRLGPRRTVPRGRHRRLRRRVRRRPHAQPLPALQREDQVLGGARPGARARLRRRRHRSSRPTRRRPADALGRSGQGPVLRPGRLHRSASSPRDVPARRLHQGAGAGRGRRARPGRRRQAGLARHLLHRRRRHPRASWPAGSARRTARSSTPTAARSLGTHGGSFGFTVGQRRGLNLQQPGAGGDPRYVLSIRPVDNTVVVGPRSLSTPTVRAEPVVWTPATAPAERFDCTVQLRAHGMTSPATASVDGAAVTAACTATARRRRRPGPGHVRRRPGARLGNHHRRRAAAPTVPAVHA